MFPLLVMTMLGVSNIFCQKLAMSVILNCKEQLPKDPPQIPWSTAPLSPRPEPPPGVLKASGCGCTGFQPPQRQADKHVAPICI